MAERCRVAQSLPTAARVDTLFNMSVKSNRVASSDSTVKGADGSACAHHCR